MRVQKAFVAGVLAVASAWAARETTTFQTVSAAEGQRLAATYGETRARIAMWIWTDKYTYQPGQSATLRWTVKSNNELYPFVIVVYRQNNQTGKKIYLPGNSEEVTDINGASLSSGFRPVQLKDVTKGVLAEGLTLPDELGMHTFTVELRDYAGTRVIKAAYMKIGVVSKTTVLTGAISSDTTLTNDTQWNLSGVVTVKNNATLTIQPGTFVVGLPGSSPPSVLLITRNGKINANGTKSRPIIMTSSQPFGQRQRGDWGGLLVLGKAPVNVGANTQGGICPATGCVNAVGTFYIEGLVANDDGLYGGTDPAHNCGTMRYVRVEFGGTILSPNNETNSFTWGGCGTGTVADHLQATYGKDDSFEWFGGTMDAKYLVGGLGADDYVDFQLGYTGRIQYGLFFQSPDQKGNRGIEGDNSEYDQAAQPYSNPTMYNLTFVGSGVAGFDEANSPGIFLRRGSRGSFNNIVVTNFYSGAIDLNDATTQAQADAGNVSMNGVLIWKNNIGATNAGNTMDGQIAQAYTLSFAKGEKGTIAGKPAGQNIIVTDPQLGRIFEYSDPDFAGAFGSPIFRAGWVAPPDDGFFDQSAKFVGGIGDFDWTEEWTSFLVETDITQ